MEKFLATLFLLTLLSASCCPAALASYQEEEAERCPGTPQCVCKWISGKRVADCADAGLFRLPRNLSPDIQTLILDGNPLRILDKNAFKSVNLLNLQKLSLRGCGLTDVADGAFRDLKASVVYRE